MATFFIYIQIILNTSTINPKWIIQGLLPKAKLVYMVTSLIIYWFYLYFFFPSFHSGKKKYYIMRTSYLNKFFIFYSFSHFAAGCLTKISTQKCNIITLHFLWIEFFLRTRPAILIFFRKFLIFAPRSIRSKKKN